ncbi:MAG: GDP-mannose 4,6-dehydratase, partial [Verrucomicrobiaceae bacterium]|nr:GDP-mannose 4,6-dehydratase [Verrucomicrobiaceae bacterium]
MERKVLFVTGSSGLIGSEVCLFFHEQGFTIHGLDNNQRAAFFGPSGDTRWNQQRLQKAIPGFVHHEMDIRDRTGVALLLKEIRPTAIVHAAAQPSHD